MCVTMSFGWFLDFGFGYRIQADRSVVNSLPRVDGEVAAWGCDSLRRDSAEVNFALRSVQDRRRASGLRGGDGDNCVALRAFYFA